MGTGRKQVRQEELRRLMREKKRQNADKKRIESPFAKYPRRAGRGRPSAPVLAGGGWRKEGSVEGGGGSRRAPHLSLTASSRTTAWAT